MSSKPSLLELRSLEWNRERRKEVRRLMDMALFCLNLDQPRANPELRVVAMDKDLQRGPLDMLLRADEASPH